MDINLGIQTTLPDRHQMSSSDIAADIWTYLGLPSDALRFLILARQLEQPSFPSSFKIGHIAQSTIGLSALAAGLVYAARNKKSDADMPDTVPIVLVLRDHAVMDFLSVQLYTIDDWRPAPRVERIGGFYRAADGSVRIHDFFPNLTQNALRVLGLPPDAEKPDVATAVCRWSAKDLEAEGLRQGACIYALRSYEEWDKLPQARALSDFPISITKIGQGPKDLPKSLESGAAKCLQGLRVLEMARAIAAPLAGRTLALHGADVIAVSSPNQRGVPLIDREFHRGKRRVFLDVDDADDKASLFDLAQTCDVFIQNYRPDSSDSQGLSPKELAAANPGIVVANLSAFGPDGPWASNLGFEMAVQAATGMSFSEAKQHGSGSNYHEIPCQPLEYSAGYLLATGISTALYRRATEGGSYLVDVSLAGVMKYLRSLGQYEGKTCFNCPGPIQLYHMAPQYFESRETGEGRLRVIWHAAQLIERDIGWSVYHPAPVFGNIGWL